MIRTALVTGATRGIGRGIALELAGLGYGLTVSARRDTDLEALARDLNDAGAVDVHLQAADLADRDAAVAAVEVHRTAFGTMDALILCAGVGTAGPLETLPAKRIDKTFAVNVGSAFALVQQALPQLRAAAVQNPQHASRVIALASIAGAYAEPGLAAYGASKAALISLMETLNAEESAHGVLATAIAPAYVNTDMSAWITDRIPAETMIQVADVVAVVRMLLSLGPNTGIPRIVMTRSGTDGHQA